MSASQRPSKRFRRDADGLQDITRSSDHWFDDGSIILQAESTQFRVGKSVLSVHSTVLRDLFSVAIPADPGWPHVEGCPVFCLHGDSAKDWKHLLDVIYPKECFTEEKPTFDSVAAILRLSKKYDLPSFRARSLACIKAEFPTVLTQPFIDATEWTRIRCPGDTFQANVDFLKLARELGIYSILPGAFYNLCADCGVSGNNKCAPKFFCDVFNQLSPSDQATCLKGYAKILHAQVNGKGSVSWLRSNEIIPSDGCSNAEKCKTAITCLAAGLTPHGLVSLFLDDWISEWGNRLCSDCTVAAKAVFIANRQQCWNELPSYFSLPDWDQLLEMDLK
ncbi:BTB domain-containing protein [Mycena kentingensis (nom. inval.)]|nr:BTB domain-containing protein [Mycena kentingensis (nom. inval.)]